MLKYKNLVVIGTSHISRESVKEIRTFIETEKPSIVAIELDKRRLYSLMNDVKSRVSFSDIKLIGFKGYLFAAFGGWMQKKLGNIVNIDPGADMKAAATLAIKNKLHLALIDRDITITLKEFSRRLTWRERFRFVGDIFRFTFRRKKEMARLGIKEFDLSKVPEKELIEKLMKEMKLKYPNVYSVLVDERNKIMAKNLFILMQHKPDAKILATVGAGHAEAIIDLVEKLYKHQEKKQLVKKQSTSI